MFEARFIYDEHPHRPTCHCACLTELPDGDLLAAWYGGQREGLPDSAILTSRFSKADGQWTRPEVIIDTPGRSDGNMVLFTAPDGRVWLWHTVIQDGGWASVLTYWRTSVDGGLTWSASRPLDPEPGLVFRCRPLAIAQPHPGGAGATSRLTVREMQTSFPSPPAPLPVGEGCPKGGVRVPSACTSRSGTCVAGPAPGRWLIPMYDDKDGSSLFLLSDDEGATWRRSTRLRVTDDQCIQPAPVVRADGSLLAYMRCGSRAGHLWQSVSGDGGETWAPCEPVDLPNPNAGVDMLSLQTGELLLAANLTTSSRSPLHLALSEDEGQTWPTRLIAAHDPGQEFSYPQLLQASTGECHLLYTWRRVRIRHLTFNAEWVRKEAAKQREHVRARA